MSKWWMPDNGTAAVGIHNSDGGWLADAAYRGHADKLVDAHNADCDDYETRIAELERRLDAVVAMLEPGEKPKYCSFDIHRIYRELYKEWEWKTSAHARAVAIAEGREP